MSNALHASHEDIRRLSAHLTEVSKRRKYLENCARSIFSEWSRLADELAVMQSAIDRIAAMLQDSAREDMPDNSERNPDLSRLIHSYPADFHKLGSRT